MGAVVGRLVTFEGIEGSGKTTQLRRLAARLTDAGHPPLVTREPGGTRFGQALRQVLLDASGPPRHPVAEVLLYLADRRQHLEETIRPALTAGQVVLCDRYHDATVAYQGFGRGLPADLLSGLTRLLDIPPPDLTILLDLPVPTGLARARARNQTCPAASAAGRFEEESFLFHERVRAGYLRLADDDPHRFIVVDADRNPDQLAETIADLVLPRLSGQPTGGEP